MTKTKIINRTEFTAPQRDTHVMHYIHMGFNAMHICRHSGSPETGLLIGRSVFPLLVTTIHARMVEKHYPGQSLNQMLEDLYSTGIIGEVTHVNLRRAAASLGDFGSGRDLKDVMAACGDLKTIVKSSAFKNASAVKRTAKAKKATDRRPALLRWASAAVGLFSVSG